MSIMNGNSDNLENQTISSGYMVASFERKSNVLQETSHNIMNRSPRGGDKKVVSERESRKRAAVSPIKSITETVRRKLDKNVCPEEEEEHVMVADTIAELEYQNWLLEQRLAQAKQSNEFLMLERQFSKLN